MAVVEHERTTEPARGLAKAHRLTVAAQVAVAAMAVTVAVTISNHGSIDLDVYRAASKALLGGNGIYDSLPGAPFDLKYIYPPFAAVILVPVTFLPVGLLHVVWTVFTVVLVFWTLHVVLGRLGVRSTELTPLALLAPTLLLEPIRGTMGFGQINMVIVALVLLDCTGVLPRRFRGIGIGIAAAIKVTPLAFGLLLLVRKDYASIVRAGIAFVLAAGVGAIFAPGDSTYFWTAVFFDTGRGGAPWYGPNQAITGPLTRLGLTGSTETLVWLVCVVAVVAAAAYAAWHFTRSGEHIAAFSVVALASLLAAPFAASHHWSYIGGAASVAGHAAIPVLALPTWVGDRGVPARRPVGPARRW